VLEHALHEALRRRDRRLGTEHLLLGVLRPPAATVGRLLSRLDVDPDRLAALVQVEAAARR
jgi:ATP-dependent Clp protease ATP-binding subunit ClpA